jgi:Tannase and feruloyl esterase
MQTHIPRNIALIVALARLPAAAATCESLATLALPNATITTAQPVTSGTLPIRKDDVLKDLPAFCRVTGAIHPSSDSDIQFEVWLPLSGWNGKFQGVGNGGFAGSINYGGLAGAVRHGYAVASTDTGHHASSGDATWALGHPQKVIDFGYRAIHETAEKAKTIIRAFYGDAPRRSYFSACSNGGRQALMEAQRFPTDYDGIVAGAPANYWTHLLSSFLWNIQATVPDPASYIPAAKLPAIEAATLSACDALDSVKDGVIDNPPRCHWDPATLQCAGAESDACLTAPQLAALKKIYGGIRDSKGAHLFPGFSVGAETGGDGWERWITGSAPGKSIEFTLGTQFFANMVFENAAWDFHTFNADRDVQSADKKLAGILNSTDPDLKRFHDRGGKLILYHGWSDASIQPVNAVRYYESVVSKMGAPDAGSFVRLFMAPGMKHCDGGPGPNSFGQDVIEGGDAQHDINRALEHWVEGGVAPEQIIATKYKEGAGRDVVRTRPLCAHPLVARWKGSGSTDDAANFVCRKPPR